MAENILQDTKSDYATKGLPQIPNNYVTSEHHDLIIIDEREEESGIHSSHHGSKGSTE